jgi:hypothetical protein
MTGMLTPYIAAVTAFWVVNFAFLPTTVRWLWPTLVGTVGIVAWVRYYRTQCAWRPRAAREERHGARPSEGSWEGRSGAEFLPVGVGLVRD